MRGSRAGDGGLAIAGWTNKAACRERKNVRSLERKTHPRGS